MTEFHIELDEDLFDRLAKLTQTENKKEIINSALTLFGWAASEIARGRTIASIDEVEKKYTEVEIPIFKNIQREDVPL